MSKFVKSCNDDERGVALALIGVSMFVIIAIVGLALDTYLATVSKTQYQAAADATALAAIETFGDLYDPSAVTDPGTRNGAMREAITRAGVVLRENVGLMLTYPYFEQDMDPSLGTGPGEQGDLGGVAAANVVAGANGVLTPGFWIDDASDPVLVSRCLNGGPVPCFAPIEMASAEIPTAYKVDITINPTSRIRTTFMQLLGIDVYSLRASAIALTQARRGVFLIDLSPSIHESTHSMFPPATSPRNETLYAYPITTNSMVPGTPDPPCVEGSFNLNPDIIYNIAGTVDESNPREVFRSLPNDPSETGGIRNPNFSYKQDFYCHKVTLQTEENDKYFAIDHQRLPEPLTGILAGVHDALLQFEGRALAGDRVGIFGFDDREEGFLQIRSTKNPSLDPSMVSPGSSEFEAAKSATAPYGAGSSPLHTSKFFFPQFFSNNEPAVPSDPPKLLNTDIKSALIRSIDVIKMEADWQTSDNFIVLFSDGKSNCNFNSGSLNCDGRQAAIHKSAMQSILNVNSAASPLSIMINDGITFHTVLVGDTVQPHTMLKVNPDKDGCLTDIEARKMLNSNIPGWQKQRFYFTRPGGGNGDANGLVGDPYPYSNRLWNGVKSAGGLWAPLREPCMLDANGDGINLMDKASPSGPAGALHRSCDSWNTHPGNNLSYNQIRDSTVRTHFRNNNLLEHGRLLCDPEGRTKEEQMKDFIDSLMGQNPIRLVGR